MSRVARVLVDSPLPQLDRLLDYRIPEGMEGVEPGVRVSVPLRSAKRLATGYVVELADGQEFPGPLSDIAALVSPVPVLRPEVWRLARAVADRAAGSANDVLRLAIPKRQARVEKAWLAREADPVLPPVEGAAVTGYAPGAVEQAVAGHRRAALEALPGVLRLPDGRWVGRWALSLVQAASHALAAGESALLVVPDERDQGQLLAAAEALLPAGAVLRWDARLSDPERYRGLLRAAAAPVLVIGNRSAVYAPAARLGLIALWDDGDSSLAEPLAPYAHARDAALVRQEQQGSALLVAGHVRSAETQRLVELGWLSELGPDRGRHPRVVPTAAQTADEPLAAQARIPSFAWRSAREALQQGPVLVQVARPGSDGVGAERTAHELGRAFPGVRVVVADGERPLFEIDGQPALVIATRGAEPVAAGGYRAVLLLDGERMLMRESLRVAEDCLRWWANAAALAADDATVVLVGVSGPLATALATGRVVEHAAAELADRRALRFPPAVRTATLEGLPDAVEAALAALPEGAEPISRSLHDERARAVVRFDYGHGAAVAEAVRAEIVRQAASRRKPVPGTPPRGRQPLPLRARFDDPEPFEDWG